jgi:DNA-3-methyladenine glycosylase
MKDFKNLFSNLNISEFQNLILPLSFYERDTCIVAQELLNKILITYIAGKKSWAGICAGRIVEVEAYYGLKDPASHARNGITPRSKIMFETPGIAYVYFCYGNHYLLNAVTEKSGTAGAVLIRSIEPLEGIDLMIARRKINLIENLTNGPGKLTKAFGIEKSFNGRNLTSLNSGIFIIDGVGSGLYSNLSKEDIIKTKRIGIKNGAGFLLRFYIKNNKFVSKK